MLLTAPSRRDNEDAARGDSEDDDRRAAGSEEEESNQVLINDQVHKAGGPGGPAPRERAHMSIALYLLLGLTLDFSLMLSWSSFAMPSAVMSQRVDVSRPSADSLTH